MSALSERLQAAKAHRSIDDIVRLAERDGHMIDRSVVARYLSGKHGPRPSDRALLALAAGLGVDVRELRALAGMPPGELEPWEPTPEAARLNREQREALNQLIRAIVRREGGSNAQQQPSEKSDDDGRPVGMISGTGRMTERPLGRDSVPGLRPLPESQPLDQEKHP